MKNVALTQHRQKIRLLLTRAPATSGVDIEMQAEWAKYICVQISGYVENIVRELYSDYVRGKAHPAITSYVQKDLALVRNPKPNRLIEITAAFDSSWGISLKTFLENDGRGDAILAIMSNRHLIVHGRNSDITLVRVREYFGKIDDVAEFLSILLV